MRRFLCGIVANKNSSINLGNFGQYVEQKINDRLFVSNNFKIFEKEWNHGKNTGKYIRFEHIIVDMP